TETGNTFVEQARQQQTFLLDQRAALQHEVDVARSRLTTGAEGGGGGDFLERLHQMQVGFQTSMFVPGHGYEDEAKAYQQQLDEAQARLDQNNQALAQATKDLGDQATALRTATDQLNKLGIEAGGATARLLSFEGSLENVISIARGDIAAQAQAA